MTCPRCSAPLDDVPIEQPCPQCGAVGRTGTFVAGTDTVGEAFGIPPSFRVEYTKQGPWRLKWQEIERQLDELEAHYSSKQAESTEHLRLMVEGFFRSCREMTDWLFENTPVTGLDKETVLNFVWGDPDLFVCDAMAQTVKHKVRQPPSTLQDPISAWVKHVEVTKTVQVQIEWESASGLVHGEQDALVLARHCVAAWRGFLKL